MAKDDDEDSWFDDDEKDEPIAFEQDADDDSFGNGDFIYADGSRKYGSDYQMAKKLDKMGKATHAAKTNDELGSIGLGPEEPPNPQTDTVEEVTAAKRPEAPPLAQQRPQAPQLPLGSQTHGVQQQETSALSRTRSAVPQQNFEQGQRAISDAYGQAQQTAEDNRFAEAAAIANRAAQVEQMGRDKEAAATAAMAQRDQRAVAVKKQIAEVSSRPTDNTKIWKDRGLLGTLSGAIALYLGSVSAAMLGRENSALKEIQNQKRQNIESQMEDRNSELRGLEKELGSLDAAIPVFEARMNDALKMKIEAQLQDERSQTALRNGRQLIDQLEIEKLAKLSEAEKAHFGTIAQQQSGMTSITDGETRTRPPAGAGSGSNKLEEALKLDKALESSGYTREQRAAFLRNNGLDPPGGQTSEEYDRTAKEKAAGSDKYSEAEGKAQSAQDALDAYAKASGLRRDPSGKWVPGDDTFDPRDVEKVNPLSDKPVRATLASAIEAYGRFQSGGVIGDEEREAFAEQLGRDAPTRAQLAARLNAAEGTIRSRRPKAEREKGPLPQGIRRANP
jgi:hypothetical protein